MKKMKLKLIAASVAASLLAGCAGHENTGAGMAIGAASGALLGQVLGHNKQSTLLGAAIGGAIGGVIGASMDSAAADAAKKLELAANGKNATGTIQMKHSDKQIALKLDDSLMFERGCSEIPATGRYALDAFAESISKLNPSEYVMFVSGHTDSSGGLIVNAPLSQSRALAVRNYLSQKLPTVKFDVRGFADASPLRGHVASDIENRRTELQFIKVADAAAVNQAIAQRAALESEVNNQLATIKQEQAKHAAQLKVAKAKSKNKRTEPAAAQQENETAATKSFDATAVKNKPTVVAANTADKDGFTTDWGG